MLQIIQALKWKKSLAYVAIILNMGACEVLDRLDEYPQLSSKDKLMSMYREMGNDDIEMLEYPYKELKRYWFR